jgi:hypothetical protein
MVKAEPGTDGRAAHIRARADVRVNNSIKPEGEEHAPISPPRPPVCRMILIQAQSFAHPLLRYALDYSRPFNGQSVSQADIRGERMAGFSGM